MTYFIIKWLHIVSSTILFGTGFGTAFYMFFGNRTGHVPTIAHLTRLVVRADWFFTAPTVIIQPLTGLMLVHLAGYPLSSNWILWSWGMFVLAGVCWLPVVWIQIKMRDIAQDAVQTKQDLPTRYWKLERIWVLLGIPAFTGLVWVFYLMVAKPTL